MRLTVKGVHRVEARGKIYHYAWRGGPRLKAEPGSDAFLAELAAAKAARAQAKTETIDALCGTFRAHREWTKLSDKTRKNWSPWLDRIQAKFGKAAVKDFDKPEAVRHIRKWRDNWQDTPATADRALEVMSRLLSFAGEEGMITTNACTRIKRLYSANRAELIWTGDDLAELERRASPEVFRAARLAALTGLRQADVLRLSWANVKANSIEMRTGKSRFRKLTLIPLYGELRAYLASLPKFDGVTTVLTNSHGLPWKTGFGASWNAVVRADPKKKRERIALHFHDLRGTAVTAFWRAGFSEREIAEIMTWSEKDVAALINRYVKRDELLRDRIRRLDANAAGTETVKPTVKRSEG